MRTRHSRTTGFDPDCRDETLRLSTLRTRPLEGQTHSAANCGSQGGRHPLRRKRRLHPKYRLAPCVFFSCWRCVGFQRCGLLLEAQKSKANQLSMHENQGSRLLGFMDLVQGLGLREFGFGVI